MRRAFRSGIAAVGNDDPSLAAPLGRIHGVVCCSQQFCRCGAMLWKQGGANAGAQSARLALQGHRLGNRCNQAIGNFDDGILSQRIVDLLEAVEIDE